MFSTQRIIEWAKVDLFLLFLNFCEIAEPSVDVTFRILYAEFTVK